MPGGDGPPGDAAPLAVSPLAMFPLGTVLLPGGAVPLHVFEPRYVQLVRDCLAAPGEPEFGQVLITHGSEVGGGDERAPVGTVAHMAGTTALGDGRYQFVAVGVRRIRVHRWLDDDPYPRAEVADWPDVVDGAATRPRIAAVTERVRGVVDLAARVAEREGHRSAPPAIEVSDDVVRATYQLAGLAPMGPADRYRLLAAPGPAERLDTLDSILDDVDAMLRFRLS